MIELWLKFKDENGEEKRLLVEPEKFTVGRHSSNDLPIPNGKLSREHIRIERFGDFFVVSDCGSSNGTEINGNKIDEPKSIQNGDRLNLGGGFEIEIETISDEPAAESGGGSGESGSEKGNAASATQAAAASASSPGGIPTSFFWLAPLSGVILLIFAGGMIYVFSSGKTVEVADKDNGFTYSSGKDKDSSPQKDTDSTKNRANIQPTPGSSPSAGNETVVNSTLPSTDNLSESAKVEQNAAAFLRRIAQNDPKAFVTGDQAQRINVKLKQFSNSSALADNIKSANRNASQIRSIAAAKNLKPQFLATAALAKLGGTRGDVLQTAQGMADVLDRLGTQIGNELADDALLMIAAYDQGQAGDFLKMRNMLQDLATKSPESSRAIRTIWFLQKQNKITGAEFDFALRFLAIGTITQNPKEFGVNAEALTL